METKTTSENIAAVLHGAGNLRMEQHPLKAIGPKDVLLAMGAVGICGSDLKYWKYGVCGRFTVTSPMVIGHEGSGTVVSVGQEVTSLKPGDRVAVEPGVPCRLCHLCRKGRYNVCRKVAFCATPPVNGNLARYYVHPADFCFKLPEHVTLEEGALCEPLAVSVYACQRGDVGLGHTVFICGAGPVGLMTMMVAKVKGASKVIMSDIDDGRLNVAKEMGADYTINVKSQSPKEIADLVDRTLGGKADVSLECSGSDVSMNACIYATESGGSVVLVGRGSITPEVALVEAASREVDLKGVFRYANCYPAALSLLAKGLINVKPLISHRFSFMDSEKAFDTAYDRSSGAMKVMINCEK